MKQDKSVIDAFNRKGFKEENGKIQTQTVYIEDKHCKKNIAMTPIIKEIQSLSEFFELLKEIHDDNELRLKQNRIKGGSIFFYRGHSDIKYLYNPSTLRSNDFIECEHLIFKEFHRRFYELFDECKTSLEKEVHLQHYEAGSRCLDILENPLYALWAACESNNDEKNKKYGEVSFWCLDRKDDKLKTFDSSKVSVIANTAKMEREFSLAHLEIEYLKEHPTSINDFIYLKDVLRSTAIVRPKYNNQRIINQWSGFAIVNLNKMTDENNKFKNKFGISVDDFSKFILESEKNINIHYIREGKVEIPGMKNVEDLNSWDICFRKMHFEEMPFVDSYDLYQYMYKKYSKNKNQIQPFYAVIPWKNKKDILNELRYLNITKSYIYPEKDKAGYDIKKLFGVG